MVTARCGSPCKERCLAVALVLALLAGLSGCRSTPTRAPRPLAATAAVMPETTAEKLLALEGEAPDDVAVRSTLLHVISRAVERYQASVPTPASESERAFAFFVAVDRTLTEEGFVFPPHGLIELLHQAMRSRRLSAEDVQTALALRENKRRATIMGDIQARGGTFRVLDCDLACVLYLAVAERLGHPVYLVVVPNHMFVRWSSPGLVKNWDPNLGWMLPDEHYATFQGVTEAGRIHLGWLDSMSTERITSYWLGRIGDWHDRHGRHVEALRAYRQAIAASPDDLEAANRLAWFLATCPRADLRDAREAVVIATHLVARYPRTEWVDTLAAALAETGDFEAAVATIRASPRAGTLGVGGAGAGEVESDSSDAVRAYARRMTYREGVTTGLIYDPRPPLAFDE